MGGLLDVFLYVTLRSLEELEFIKLSSRLPVIGDYDREADMLYISFARPQQATDTDMTDEGFLLRYRDDRNRGGYGAGRLYAPAEGNVLRRTAAWKKWHC